jgi:hypothetical protein
MCPQGEVSLYASCFAAMTLHYVGELSRMGVGDRKEWAEYINSWQDPRTGIYLGPEIGIEELTSPIHDYEYVTTHLAVHALPALALLGASPRYPLHFSLRFLDKRELGAWLDRRNWTDAWLEGNNLLFIGQLLIHLRDIEGRAEADVALRVFFDWLNARVDPRTGLWGTNRGSSPFVAMCGAYHQFLVYYHEDEEIGWKERIVDTVLSLQHTDGGFQPRGGGGACEDVDAVDILVNLYKRIPYRRRDIRIALRKAAKSILSKQMADGGFVYRIGEPFAMGVRKTRSPANVSNLFSTWFRVHTLALIGEILTDADMSRYDWKFNDVCSMGWHRPWDKNTHRMGLVSSRRYFPGFGR